jgi:hypothetical protein
LCAVCENDETNSLEDSQTACQCVPWGESMCAVCK